MAIEHHIDIPVVRQCELLNISRACIYRPIKTELRLKDLIFAQLIEAEYSRHPFYGSRRMVVYLQGLGYAIGRRRVRRIMRSLGLAGMSPNSKTTRPF